MSRNAQIILLAIGGFYYLWNVVLAVREHFKGSGMSAGSRGASIPILVVLFLQPWPLWLRCLLAPLVVVLELSWVAVARLLGRWFPRRLESGR